jgi:anthranilate phosphoribosyltransferase
MFAQAFHPAMRHAAPVRREIGIRTVFNILGPLTNPAGAQSLLLGVASPGLGETMAQVLLLLGIRHALVVHGDGGLDEISTSGDTEVWEVAEQRVSRWTVRVEETGLPKSSIEEIRGGSKEDNAATMRRIFQGEPGPIRDVVLLNSAGVLLAGDLVETMSQGVQRAAEVVDSGAALAKLDALVDVSQGI